MKKFTARFLKTRLGRLGKMDKKLGGIQVQSGKNAQEVVDWQMVKKFT